MQWRDVWCPPWAQTHKSARLFNCCTSLNTSLTHYPDFTHNPSQQWGQRTSCGQPLRNSFITVIIHVETLHLCHTVRLARQISNNLLMATLCWVSLGAIKVSDIYICLMNHRAVAASGNSWIFIHACAAVYTLNYGWFALLKNEHGRISHKERVNNKGWL